ncbi:MAG TPA: zinc-dependent peptidase [Leeuwenhoekiella sp.]|nr:zinc-dependent peptidase [Leeuwenhoekiella sp.]
MIITFILFGLLLVFIIYAFSHYNSKKVEKAPIIWDDLLLQHVHFYKELNPERRKLFKKRMSIFLSETYIEGVDLDLEELDRVFVAASAVIPVFGFKEWHYTNLTGVLLYPDRFNKDFAFEKNEKGRIITGMVGNGRLKKQMILSRKALRKGFSPENRGNNTAIHEFVHLIDKMDGQTDGVPERLMEHAYSIPWLKLIHKEMEKINTNTSDIRNYGGTNEAEFLAVASEYFFEKPEQMEKKHPELYKMLLQCFNVKKPDKKR